MKKSTMFSGFIASAVFAASMLAPSVSQAAPAKSYPSCSSIEKQLTAKIKRLVRLAAERRSKGDHYGSRRLLSTANVIAAHRGNLHCVNRQTCGIR